MMTDSEYEKLTPIQRAQAKRQEMQEAGLLQKSNPLDRFINQPKIGRAVKMFCYECNGYSRHEANNCANADCPLWLFRRGKHAPEDSELSLWRQKYTEHMKAANEFECRNNENDLPDADEACEEVEDEDNDSDE